MKTPTGFTGIRQNQENIQHKIQRCNLKLLDLGRVRKMWSSLKQKRYMANKISTKLELFIKDSRVAIITVLTALKEIT